MTVTTPRAHLSIDTLHDVLAQFDAEYADILPAVSSRYFHANERLTDRQRMFIQALLHIGNTVNSIAADYIATMQRDPEPFEQRRAAFQRRTTVKIKWQELCDGFAQQDQLTREYAGQQHMSKREFADHYEDFLDVYRAEYEELERELFIESSFAYQWHEQTYGAAFRSALQDIGIVFANGETAFDQKVTNADEMQGLQRFLEDHQKSLSYYPAAWVERITFPLHIYASDRMFDGSVGYKKDSAPLSVYLRSSDYPSALHEWGHVMEIANPLIGRAERLFIMYEREVTNFGAVRHVQHNQYTVANSLIHEYAGVYYRGRRDRHDHMVGHMYEALTTGAESMFLGRFGGLTTDPDHRARRHADFLLGLYAILGRQ